MEKLVFGLSLAFFFGDVGYGYAYAAQPDTALQVANALEQHRLFEGIVSVFEVVTKSWAPAFSEAATRLFWSLATISMVWTFGKMALHRAEMADSFAEFVSFTVCTGFQWWLLVHAEDMGGRASSPFCSLAAKLPPCSRFRPMTWLWWLFRSSRKRHFCLSAILTRISKYSQILLIFLIPVRDWKNWGPCSGNWPWMSCP